MRSFQTTVLLPLLLTIAVWGCDRRESSTSATTAPPTGGPPPRPTAVERYATYRQNVQPVVDELTAVQAMPENPATLTFANLDARVQALAAADARLAWKVTDEDKGRESYQKLVAAVAATVKAHRCWNEENGIDDSTASGPHDSGRLLNDLVKVANLHATVNESLTAAYINIYGMNTALKSGK